ncbi:MAG TPA: PEP-utilizing enzyme, partial [Polyangiaceae bacterium]|nr:PEP-utilizing enzyme [Polyangiaceae bacterium]
LAPLSEGRGAQAAPAPLEELRDRLEPAGFEQLLEAGTVAEREIGKGAVVHFGVTGKKVHVLGVDEHPRWAPLGGGDEATTWVTIGLGMRGLEPTTRLTQSVIERVVRDALESTLATLRCKPEQPLIGSRDGHSYLNLVALAEATADLPLVSAEDVLTAVGGFSVDRIRRLSARHLGDRGSLWRWPLTGTSAMREQYALERSAAELERGIERDTRALVDMDFTLLPADALSTTLTSAQALLERCAGLWCRFTAAQLGCQLTLRSLLRRRIPDVPDGVTGALTSGVGGLFFASMAPAFARVVSAFHGEPQVAALLRDRLADGGKLSRPGDLPDGRARGALGQFLARYGDIAFGAFELAVPRWRDDASELLRMVALALELGPVRFENEQRARALADAELLRFEPELSRVERSAVRHLIERYRRLAVGRSSVERHVLRALRLLRAVTVDIDRRLRRIDPAIVEGGAYHCSAERLAGAMKSGRPELTRIIRMRSTERAAESLEPAPPLAFAGSPPRGAIPLLPTTQLYGLGVSPGVIEGRARLVHGVLPDAVHPGEVLVVSALDPALAPLVAISGAVVAELGGIVSSGAELARELAVPCVTGVADAALHLRDGERLRVDGERGTIQRLELSTSVEATGPRPSVESDTRAFSG